MHPPICTRDVLAPIYMFPGITWRHICVRERLVVTLLVFDLGARPPRPTVGSLWSYALQLARPPVTWYLIL